MGVYGLNLGLAGLPAALSLCLLLLMCCSGGEKQADKHNEKNKARQQHRDGADKERKRQWPLPGDLNNQ